MSAISPWAWALIALIALLLLAVGTLVGIFVGSIRGGPTFDCAIRVEGREGHVRWKHGTAVYGPGELRWHRMTSPRASRSWSRWDIDVIARREPEEVERAWVMNDATIVTVAIEGKVYLLAMTPEAYTGFAAWIESAAPR